MHITLKNILLKNAKTFIIVESKQLTYNKDEFNDEGDALGNLNKVSNMPNFSAFNVEQSILLYRVDKRMQDSGRSVVMKDSNIVFGTTPRRSRDDTSNYYTLWMSNHPSWQKFPRRDKSFIAATSSAVTSQYSGALYIIIPANDAKIGICNTDDIWSMFQVPTGTNNPLVILALDHLNKFLEILRIPDDDFNSMQRAMLNINKGKKLNEFLEELDPFSWDQSQRRIDRLHNNYFYNLFLKSATRNLYDWYADLLDPYKNNLKFETGAKWNRRTLGSLGNDRELWIQGKCLFVLADDTLIDNLKELRGE